MSRSSCGWSVTASISISAALLCAQQSGTIQGEVLSSITGRGVEGVAVTMYTQDAVRYTGTTDASGVFRITGVAPGTYYARLDKDGYFTGPRSETGYPVGPGFGTPRPRIWITRDAAVRGRVTDARGDPAAGVRVSGLGTTNTNERGEFEIKGVMPGAYVALATPPPSDAAVQAIPTYSPRFVVRDEDVERIEIRLQEAEVYRIRGVVLSATGDPVPRVRVQLQPIVQREPWAMSGSPFISISGAYRGAGAVEATVMTDDDGTFEFFPVRNGDWFVSAQSTASYDSPDFNASVRVAVEEVRMGRADVEGVRLRLQAPFPFEARGVRLTPLAGSGIAAIPQIAGRMLLPGTYVLEAMPRAGEYTTSIRLDGREVMGQPVALISSSQRFEVTTQPARGTVQGRVIGGEGMLVLIPAPIAGFGFGYSVPAREDGSFRLTGVAPGDYYAAAIAGYDRRRGMTLDAVQLQRIAILGTRFRVTQDAPVNLELRPMPWLE